MRYNTRTVTSNVQCICSKSYLFVCDMQFSVCVVFRVSFHSHLHHDSTMGLSTEGLLWPVLHTALLVRGEGRKLSSATHLGSHDWKLACKWFIYIPNNNWSEPEQSHTAYQLNSYVQTLLATQSVCYIM